ncbi:LysM peptidoglycan-binding domain-containing protein [Planctomonas sp. JC2975]|uniref:LysM peptidoglycan-binding domain-containing protein n=1 Tax=Planctomonas sp. JC2975 TaxID=2729626 RepID=UPI0014765FEA|nr:LysM peptidoglycan-binding domain-containing protein [Planctomonas sp. JC2975]NNC13370.1 LysM peptidoglycan-binding domain-containing protein [Planctomonas sp. JC2975]
MTTFVLTQQQPPVRIRTRLTRRGRVVIAALIVLPLLIGAGALAANSGAVAGAVGTSSAAFHHVTVRSGDSLWSIAERIAPQYDPRDVVAALVDLNGLQSSVLQAGQQLAVPHEYDGR